MSESPPPPVRNETITPGDEQSVPHPEGQYELIPAEIIDGELVFKDSSGTGPQGTQIFVAIKNDTSISATYQSINYGGYPPPAFIELAEKYHPGATKEIFDAFRSEREHRQYLDKQSQAADISIAKVGLWTGTTLCSAVVLSSLYMFANGNIKGGSAALGIGGIISIFAYLVKVTRAKREDLDKIQEPKTSPSPPTNRRNRKTKTKSNK